MTLIVHAARLSGHPDGAKHLSSAGIPDNGARRIQPPARSLLPRRRILPHESPRGPDLVRRASLRFVAAELRRAFPAPEGAQDFDRRGLVDADGTIRGAFIPWIARYREVPLEEAAARARWEHWLTDVQPDIADTDRAMARAISTLLAFDYVTANWDRWSGGNVAQDGATGTLLYVDNDGAFYESPPEDALARQLALLRRVRRFSRSFVAALRALDAGAIHDFLGSDLEGDLLTARVVADADARRKTVLAAAIDHRSSAPARTRRSRSSRRARHPPVRPRSTRDHAGRRRPIHSATPSRYPVPERERLGSTRLRRRAPPRRSRRNRGPSATHRGGGPLDGRMRPG